MTVILLIKSSSGFWQTRSEKIWPEPVWDDEKKLEIDSGPFSLSWLAEEVISRLFPKLFNDDEKEKSLELYCPQFGEANFFVREMHNSNFRMKFTMKQDENPLRDAGI